MGSRIDKDHAWEKNEAKFGPLSPHMKNEQKLRYPSSFITGYDLKLHLIYSNNYAKSKDKNELTFSGRWRTKSAISIVLSLTDCTTYNSLHRL